jgi:hypothetical protein
MVTRTNRNFIMPLTHVMSLSHRPWPDIRVDRAIIIPVAGFGESFSVADDHELHFATV